MTILLFSGSSYVSSVDTSAQSNFLDPVLVFYVAEKRSKTRAYQTESGDTTKAPWSRVETWRPNHDEVQAVTAIKRLREKRVAVNSLHTFVLGVTKHQTVVQ